MGYYIETEGVKGKAQALVDLHEAHVLAQAPDTFDDGDCRDCNPPIEGSG